MPHIRERVTSKGEVRYAARHRAPDGREVVETWATASDAKHRVNELTGLKVSGTYVDPRSGRESVSYWATRWLEAQHHLAPNSKTSVDGTIRLHLGRLGPMPLAHVTQEHVRQWVAVMVGTASPRSI